MAASTADATTGDERIAQWREHRETERRTARGPSNEHMLADMRGGTKCLFRAADTRLRRMFSKPHGKLVRYHHQLWGFKAVGALRTKMGSRSDTRVFLRRRAERHVRYALRRAALWAREFDVFSVLILLAGRRWLHPDALVVEPSIASIAANHRSQRVVRASTHTVQLTPLTQLLELLLEI